ncbi:MAG: ABC transporter permease [Vicinamibacterales bacterium]
MSETPFRVGPPRGWEALDLAELWDFRELVWFLVWRDVKVRYKRALLGVAWALVQPAMTMVIFTIVFGRLAGLPSEGVPYPLFTLAALLPWQLFSGAVNGSSNSLIGNSALLSKVYFPRLIMPLASVAATVVDLAVALGLLVVMMAWYAHAPTAAILTLPLFVVIALVTAFGIGLWITALTVKYRDVQYLIPFAMQFLLLASPVAYSSQVVPDGTARMLFALNPLVGIVQGFRWALLGTAPPTLAVMAPSLLIATVLLVSGLFFFRRMEATFADVI